MVMRYQRVTDPISTDFRPILKVYVTGNYQETELIQGEIKSPVIFVQDLSELPNPVTELTLSHLGGQYSLTVNPPR